MLKDGNLKCQNQTYDIDELCKYSKTDTESLPCDIEEIATQIDL